MQKKNNVQNISEYDSSNSTGIQHFSPSLNQPSLSFVPIYLAIHLKVSLGYPMQRASPDWLKIDQWVSLKGTRWNDRLHWNRFASEWKEFDFLIYACSLWLTHASFTCETESKMHRKLSSAERKKLKTYFWSLKPIYDLYDCSHAHIYHNKTITNRGKTIGSIQLVLTILLLLFLG